MKIASGHSVEHIDEEEMKAYRKDFTGFIHQEAIRLHPDGWVLTKQFLKFQEKVCNFKFKPDDVVVMTYSKCGTTWMQEIVWNMRNNPNLDNPEAGLTLFARSPYLESDMMFSLVPKNLSENKPDAMIGDLFKKFQTFCPGKDPSDGLQIQTLEGMPENRTIKTHLPFSILPKDLLSTAKVIFVARNPKDVALSFMHHHRLMVPHSYVGSQEKFIDHFVKGELIYGDFAAMVKEGWERRNHPNMHFVFFEDLKENIDEELKKINDFIGTNLTEQQLLNIKSHTSFESMKKQDNSHSSGIMNPEQAKKEGGFIRKGAAGGWRGKMTDEESAKIDAYVAEKFQGTGLKFKF